MTDIAERLRALARSEHDDLSIGEEAAAEITRLREENAKLSKPISMDSHYWVPKSVYDTAAYELTRLRARVAELERGMLPILSSEELKIIEKNCCSWLAFSHAFGALIKHRRARMNKESSNDPI